MNIDLNKIKEYTGADDSFTYMLFDKFLGHLDQDIEELQQETEDKNWPAVKGKAHSMLSSARIFFLTDIIMLSKEIEVNCENGEVEQVPKQVAKLVNLYKEVENDMRNLRKTN